MSKWFFNKIGLYEMRFFASLNSNVHCLINLNPGEIPERSNGADCKSVGEAFGGSNPPLPTFFYFIELG